MGNIQYMIDSLPQLSRGGEGWDMDRSTSFHESAHALIVILSNQVPEHVSLDPAYVRFPHNKLSARAQVQMTMAGVIAEAIYCNSYSWPKTDREQLIDAINRFKVSQEVLNSIWVETHDLLRSHWHWVGLIANRLYDKGSLTNEDLTELIKQCDPVRSERNH